MRLSAFTFCCSFFLLLTGCDANDPGAATKDDAKGLALFQTYCAACHQADGSGQEARIPPLAGSSWVSGPEERIIRIVLHGLRGPIEVKGTTFEVEMLGFGAVLRDEEVASVLTYVRRRFGDAPAVTTASVNQVREATKDRAEYWTAEELLAIPGVK
ncbi:MAG: cytochrome c [Phycisphaeraceae bacterium]